MLVDILEDTSLAGIFELNTCASQLEMLRDARCHVRLRRFLGADRYITGEVNLKSVSADEKYNQYAGRPNWNRIGQSIGDSFPTSDVGVFLCGPNAIGKQLSAMTSKMNKSDTTRRFVLHKDSF